MSVVQRLLTKHIDIWAAGDTERKSGRGRASGSAGSVYGVKKLRELILALAMQGTLVPQDANDEPANALLIRNKAQKDMLIRSGKIRPEKSLESVPNSQNPIQLPKGWAVEQLGKIAHLITKGTTPTSIGFSYQSSGIRFIKVENVSTGRVVNSANDQYLSSEADEALSRSRLQENDVLFSIAGTIGKTCVIHKDDLPANTNQAFAIIRGTNCVFDHIFLLRQLDSFVSNDVKKRARGGAMNNVSLGDLSNLTLLIPPLDEQRRIVSKVDELMALCDQLESQHSEAVEAHEKLVGHLLSTLTNTESAEDFGSNWQRVAAQFDTLFNSESSIDQLKQTLLQLAVMGRLVPQDQNEETAESLLRRIAADKAKSAVRSKNTKAPIDPSLVRTDVPFSLPKSWKWVRPEQFCLKITDGEHFRPPTENSGVYFLSAKDVRESGISLDDPLYVSEITAEKARQRCDPEYGDLLIVSRGATVGRMCKVDIHDTFCLLGSVILLKPSKLLSSDYLAIALKSPRSFDLLINASGSTAQPAIYLKDLKEIEVPLPPLGEQNRIVAKIDELMALCDGLKSRLQDANQLQRKLADVLVEQAVA